MASYEKRNGKYRVVISVMDKGVRRKVSKTFEKKKDATVWATSMESDKFQNKKIIASSMLFPDYFDMWVVNYKKNNVRESTYLTGYRTAKAFVRSQFADVKLSDLSHPLIQTRIDKFGETHRKDFVKALVSKIKASLKDAQYDGFITHDFYSRIQPRGLESTKGNKALSIHDFEKLQKYLYDNSNKDLYLALLIALETGARIGEVLALTYSDVSVPFHTLNINKSYSEKAKKTTLPKNKNSVRHIAITQQLVAAIMDNKRGKDADPIFVCSLARIERCLYRTLEALEIPRTTVHGLRHSHASYLLYKGVSINYVSSRLGHANISITQRVYAHMLHEEKVSETEKTLKILDMSPDVPSETKKA